MSNEPNLFAVFGPDGKRLSDATESKSTAWGSACLRGYIRIDDNTRRLKRAGYTCREVQIVPVEKESESSMLSRHVREVSS